MARRPTARSVAAGVLVRVARDAAFAAASLDAELDRAIQLEPRDRALATELVYGSLRLRPWLEARIERHVPRGLRSTDPAVAAHLLIAAYQLAVLTRIPPFAAVGEAVTETRALRGERVGGFVNAVLRKVAAEPRPSDDELAEGILRAIDPALAEALVRAVGTEGARAIVAGDLRAPSTGLRIEGVHDREEWLTRLRAARPDATFELGAWSPLAIVARSAGRPADLPGVSDGALSVQEEGSQLVALALGVRPGDQVLDACAGRGNKTAILARAAGDRGAVDAADLHPSKLERLASELDRLGLTVRATHPVDFSVGTGGIEARYDRVLVDAPCSGSGTFRRRPDLLLRRRGADLASLATLQRAILTTAAGLVRPGGRIVYAVCSVLEEEAEGVIGAAAEVGLAPAPFDVTIPPFSGKTEVRLAPHLHGTDGYFVASFTKT